MKIRIEKDTLSGTAAEIMDQLRGRVFDPTEFPDTESYIWFLQNNDRIGVPAAGGRCGAAGALHF